MTVLTDTQIVNASGGLVELGYLAYNSGNVVVTSGTNSYIGGTLTCVCDGSPVIVETYVPRVDMNATADQWIQVEVDGVSQGRVVAGYNPGTQNTAGSTHGRLRITPSAGSHTFRMRAYSNNATTTYLTGGGVFSDAFLRISKIVQATQWPAVTTGTIICTSSTRPSSPFQGQWIYETDTSRNYQWTGTAWSMQTKVAVALASAAAQTSMATGATLTGMTTTQTFNGLPVFVNCQAMFDGPAVGNWIAIGVYLDGTLQQYTRAAYLRTSEANFHLPISAMFTPTAGSHTVDVRVQSQSVTTWNSYNRVLNLYEVG